MTHGVGRGRWAVGAAVTLWGSPAAGVELAAPPRPRAELQVGVGARQQVVPPLQSTSRDRFTAGLAGTWRPGPQVALDVAIDALRWDRYADGHQQLGGGDIRLGTRLRLWPGPVEGGLRAQVKLPDAEDELGLGTDETDIGLSADLSGVWGPARLQGGGGVDLRGDPNALRARVAVPVVDLSAETGAVGVVGHLQLHGELPAAREPGRLHLRVGAGLGCPWSAGVVVLAGAGRAGPRVGGEVSVGWRTDCPAAAGSEAAGSEAAGSEAAGSEAAGSDADVDRS